MDGCIVVLEDGVETVPLETEVGDETAGVEEESLAEIEVEGTLTSLDVVKKEEEADGEGGSAEDETSTEEEAITGVDESVGSGDSVEAGSGTVGSGDGENSTVEVIDKSSKCEMVSAKENGTIL